MAERCTHIQRGTFAAGFRSACAKSRAREDAAFERGFQAGLAEAANRAKRPEYEGEVLELDLEIREW